MSETQTLLGKIAALRQRLAQAQGLAQEAGTAAVTLAGEDLGPLARVLNFERQVAAGTQHDLELAGVVRSLAASDDAAPTPLPRQLTSRARRLLERGQELLAKLKRLADVISPSPANQLAAELVLERDDPLSPYHRETTAMIDAALRMVPLFPDSASTQLTLCEGLEVTLSVVGERVRRLETVVARRRAENAQVDRLARLLTALETGQSVEVGAFVALAEEILDDAQTCGPLRFLQADVAQPARFVAAHSLTVARVMARVARHEPELRGRPLEPLLAALVHDIGMLQVPPALLARSQPLDDDDRRAIEAHCHTGAKLVARMLPDAAWLSEAAASHHERLDGTGYPDGLREFQLSNLTRLLTVCDVYAALCTDRPHRTALETRTAMADTLLIADQGLLDRHHAERLLQLSFYPVGSVVELADGSIAVVVATPGTRRDYNHPARPVVTVLIDSNNVPFALPQTIDLGQCERYSIVRSLARAERRAVLGTRLLEWLCE
jgi:HD-GYP domain-containing protein (c-di-GMP phosphodiesterase class II)